MATVLQDAFSPQEDRFVCDMNRNAFSMAFQSLSLIVCVGLSLLRPKNIL